MHTHTHNLNPVTLAMRSASRSHKMNLMMPLHPRAQAHLPLGIPAAADADTLAGLAGFVWDVAQLHWDLWILKRLTDVKHNCSSGGIKRIVLLLRVLELGLGGERAVQLKLQHQQHTLSEAATSCFLRKHWLAIDCNGTEQRLYSCVLLRISRRSNIKRPATSLSAAEGHGCSPGIKKHTSRSFRFKNIKAE